MRLLQIPFSHNCVKVRRALELKGLPFEVENVPPTDREAVRGVSGQNRVPVLVDGGRAIADSTTILLYLEETYPARALLPADPEARAECLLLEDWADAGFMELSRRLAYANILKDPRRLEAMFFPGGRGPAARLKTRLAAAAVRRRFGLSARRNARDEVEARRRAGLAVARLGGRPYLVGESVTIADVGLAAMTAPLSAVPALRADPEVARLLEWGGRILGREASA